MIKMKPNRTKFSYSNAYILALASKAVYQCTADKSVDENKVLEIMRGQDAGYISVKGFSKKSSQGAIIKHKDYIIIAFRGTDELVDWLDNINVFPVDRYFGKVHNGFYQALMDIWQGEKGMWEEIKNETLPFWITGHSLGGAVATLAAADLIEKDQPFYGAYTYGQPRCGNRVFSRTFNIEAKDRFFRFQNNNDIVTRAPSRLAGYSHVGKSYYISADKSIDDDVGIWYKFLDSVRGAIDSLKEEGLDAVADHNIGDYLEAIKIYADKE